MNIAQARRIKIMSKTIRYMVIITSSLCMLLPFVWMLSASFKSNQEVFQFPIQWIPRSFKFDNYLFVWQKTQFVQLFLNSVKLMAGITTGQVITCSLAAYAFSKIEFPERNVLFLGYLATMMVPFQVIMIPQFILMRKLGLTDSHFGLILLEAFSPFGVFLLVQFFKGIPKELSEAARIDGLGEFGIYAQIVMPLCKPALASLVIFAAVKSWNEFLQPLIYLNSTRKLTIQVGLRALVTENAARYGAIMAASIISVIPIILIYIFLQQYFEEGVATTGIKG
jgi:multiple sugar transport system permease protein